MDSPIPNKTAVAAAQQYIIAKIGRTEDGFGFTDFINDRLTVHFTKFYRRNIIDAACKITGVFTEIDENQNVVTEVHVTFCSGIPGPTKVIPWLSWDVTVNDTMWFLPDPHTGLRDPAPFLQTQANSGRRYVGQEALPDGALPIEDEDLEILSAAEGTETRHKVKSTLKYSIVMYRPRLEPTTSDIDVRFSLFNPMSSRRTILRVGGRAEVM